MSAIFHDTIAHDPSRRSAFLDHACADDPTLRADVEALLNADRHLKVRGTVAAFPHTGAAGIAAPMLVEGASSEIRARIS